METLLSSDMSEERVVMTVKIGNEIDVKPIIENGKENIAEIATQRT